MKDKLNLLAILLFIYFFFISPGELSKMVANLDANKLTAVGTLAAVVVALFGDQIRSNIFPPKVRLIDKWQDIQNVNQGQTRLLFKNRGVATAYEVEVYVNKIKDNGVIRSGFLPVPLIWTHTPDTNTKRDFHPNQFRYIDLCRIDNINNPSIEPKIPLIFGAGVDTYQNIYHGRTELELVVFQKSGDVITYKVELEWIRGEDKFVRVLEFIRVH